MSSLDDRPLRPPNFLLRTESVMSHPTRVRSIAHSRVSGYRRAAVAWKTSCICDKAAARTMNSVWKRSTQRGAVSCSEKMVANVFPVLTTAKTRLAVAAAMLVGSIADRIDMTDRRVVMAEKRDQEKH